MATVCFSLRSAARTLKVHGRKYFGSLELAVNANKRSPRRAGGERGKRAPQTPSQEVKSWSSALTYFSNIGKGEVAPCPKMADAALKACEDAGRWDWAVALREATCPFGGVNPYAEVVAHLDAEVAAAKGEAGEKAGAVEGAGGVEGEGTVGTGGGGGDSINAVIPDYGFIGSFRAYGPGSSRNSNSNNSNKK